MEKETITFRLDPEKRKALDAIAAGIDRDRSYILNEAVAAYIDIHKWQIEHIKEGLKQANAGEFVTDKEMAATLKKLRK